MKKILVEDWRSRPRESQTPEGVVVSRLHQCLITVRSAKGRKYLSAYVLSWDEGDSVEQNLHKMFQDLRKMADFFENA